MYGALWGLFVTSFLSGNTLLTRLRHWCYTLRRTNGASDGLVSGWRSRWVLADAEALGRKQMRFYTVKQLRLHLSELVLVRAEMVPSVSRLAACKKARKLWGVPCYDVITAREASKEPVKPILT